MDTLEQSIDRAEAALDAAKDRFLDSYKTCRDCQHSEQRDYGVHRDNIKTYCTRANQVVGRMKAPSFCFEKRM